MRYFNGKYGKKLKRIIKKIIRYNKSPQKIMMDLRKRTLNDKYLGRDNIKIGEYSYGIENVYMYDNATRLTVGKFCSIADGVIFMLGGEHRTDWVTTYPFNAKLSEYSWIKGHPATKGDITIGNDVWISSGARIMSGVKIGNGAVIGAGALVNKNVEAYSIVGGVPAKTIGYRFDEVTRKELNEARWWDLPDEQIAEIVPKLQSSDVRGVIEYCNDWYNKFDSLDENVKVGKEK